MHDAGSSSYSISDQVAQFVVHDTERVKRGSMPSKKAGIFLCSHCIHCMAACSFTWLFIIIRGIDF